MRPGCAARSLVHATAGRDFEDRLDPLTPHTVNAVVKIGDDARVVRKDTHTLADLERVRGSNRDDTVFLRETGQPRLRTDDQAVTVALRYKLGS